MIHSILDSTMAPLDRVKTIIEERRRSKNNAGEKNFMLGLMKPKRL